MKTKTIWIMAPVLAHQHRFLVPPDSISRDGTILVLERQGYETAVVTH